MRRLPLALLALLLPLGALPLAVADDSEQATLQKMVDELRPIVSRLRGLEWKQDVPASVMSRDQLIEFMLEKMDEDFPPEKRDLALRLMRRHHLVRPDEDPLALELEMMKEMVAGFYDPDTKRFYIIEGMVGEGQKPTIAHELVHALEDQHYDLESIEKPFRDHDPDRVFAIRCMWEGSAEWIRRRFQQQDPAVDAEYYRQQFEQPEERAEVQARLLTELVPAHMVIGTLLHYRIGPNFILNAVGDDLKGGMERLIADPPRTQEQVLHPERWLGEKRDLPRRIIWDSTFDPEVSKYATIPYFSTVGELDLATYLDYFLGDNNGRLTEESQATGRYVAPVAQQAAQGWDAGQTVYLEGGSGRLIVAQALAFDSQEDAREAAVALAEALAVAYVDSFVAGEWEPVAGAPDSETLLFASEHGVGRMLRRGREVLLLDGVTARQHAELWPDLLLTRFEQAEGDVGDDPQALDPFVGCAIVNEGRGLGLCLPDESWTAEGGDGDDHDLATATKDDLVVNVRVIDQEMTPEGLRHLLRGALGPVFRGDRVVPVTFERGVGLQHPVGTGPVFAIYAISDAARTYLAIVRAPPDSDRAAIQLEVGRILNGVRSVPSY